MRVARKDRETVSHLPPHHLNARPCHKIDEIPAEKVWILKE